MATFEVQKLTVYRQTPIIDYIQVDAPTAEEAQRMIRDNDGIVGENVRYIDSRTVDVGPESTTTIISCKSP